MRLRRRVNPRITQEIGVDWKRPWSPPNSPWVLNNRYTNYQWFTQTGWPYYRLEACLDEVHPGPPYVTGGPFNKWVTSSTHPDSMCNGIYTGVYPGWGDFKYVGGFCSQLAIQDGWFSTGGASSLLLPTSLTNAQLASHTFGSVDAYGSKAWTKFRPGESIADAAVFFGEISDVPRMLKTTASAFSREFISRFGKNPRGYAKNAADHWLNTQFGWLPFISDLRKFYKAWKVMDKWYDNLVRNNGQWVKRGGTVRKDNTQVVLFSHPTFWYTYPDFRGYTQYCPPGAVGKCSVTRVARQKVWFEASYRYYVPEIRSVEWKRKAILHLFGADLNPSTIWELTPWSWLVDWFSNVGDLLNAHSNTGLFANLATKYSYLMGDTSEVIRQESYIPMTGKVLHATYEASLSRKTRKAGGSFGFDLSDGALTARQWSILSALGITRLH